MLRNIKLDLRHCIWKKQKNEANLALTFNETFRQNVKYPEQLKGGDRDQQIILSLTMEES